MKYCLPILFLVFWLMPGGVTAQTAPELEVLTPDVCMPQPVRLRVKNCSGCTAFDWKIGTAAYQAGADQFSKIITTAGSYDVVVVVTTSSGLKFPVSMTNAFRVHAAPQIDLRFNRQATCGLNDTFVFTDSTRNSVSRDWMLESQMISNGPRALQHLFAPVVGYKRLYMVVRDSWGCASSKLFDSFFGVWNTPRVTPVPAANSGCLPKRINFTATNDLQGQQLDYHKWWFPGANPDSIISSAPSVLFNRSDTFSYRVMLRTKQGCSAVVNMPKAILIGDSASLKLGTMSGDLCIRQRALFSVSGSRSGKPEWRFSGAGSFTGDSVRGLSVTGGFNDTGWVNVTVSETDRGCTSLATINRAFRIKGPKADFESLITNYCATPDTLLLKNNSATAAVTTWNWTIYDSTNAVVHTSTSKDITRLVNDLNRFSARLIASSTNGCADTVYKKDVMIGGHISSEFSIAPNPACPGQKVILTPAAGPGSTRVRHQFSWSVFDGTGKLTGTSGMPKPELTFPADGRYSIRLVIKNSRNCTDSLFKKDSVIITSPDIDLSVTDSLICTGGTVGLKAIRLIPVKGFTSYWIIKHLDSPSISVWRPGDSTSVTLNAPGPYSATYYIEEASTGSCRKAVLFRNKIKVSGSVFRPLVTPAFGCAPLNVSVSATISADYNFTGTSRPTSYRWIRSRRQGFPITDTTAPGFSSSVQSGRYELRLAYTGKSGCTDTSGPVLVESGVTSSINVPFAGRCRGTQIQLLNYSSPWRDSLRYVCDSAGVRFFPSATDPSPRMTTTKGGDFVVKLIVKYKGCSDTSSAIVRVESAKADFYSNDTITYCAPKLVQIFNASPWAMVSKWYFGNGDSAISYGNDRVNQIFTRNNSSPGYDATLIVTNYIGCRDTLRKKGYFRVIGPVPELKLANFDGCEPLRVRFINNSRDYNRFFLDFGDGSVTDSVQGKTHDYMVTDKSLPVQFFKPKMLVSDTFGCFALAVPDDSVRVLKNAEAHFVYSSARFLRKTEGCAGDLLVNFSDRSRFSVKNYWDFDGNDTIDIRNQPNPNFLYGNPGRFRPRLIAENLNGCLDTVTIDSIIVWEKPEPDFKPSRDSFCARDEVKFWYTGRSAHPIKSYRWDFGEAFLLNDTATSKDARWKYQAPFDKPVSIRVTDVNGCTKTYTRGVYVLDTAGPARPEIAFVTVRDDQYVDLNWEQARIGNYYRYHIYLDSTRFLYRFSSTPRRDTMRSLFKGNVLDNKRFCYAVRLEDTCSQMGKMSVSHCTILLRDTARELYHIHLNWLSYDGWSNNLSHYEVFRKDPGGSFRRVGSVPAGSQTYTDSFLCDLTYCYYVEAVHKNRVYRSRSNEVCDKPIYRKPAGTSNITLVSVENDSFPRVWWNSTYNRIPGSRFILEKSASGQPGTFGYAGATTASTFSDRASDAHAGAYHYRVVFKDHCGTNGDPGSVSNSIHLRGVPGARRVMVAWNSYNYWHSGVKEYKLQVRGRDRIYRDWLVMSPGANSKDSIDLESFSLDTICFRIAAVKDSIGGDTSYSNSHCFIPGSYLWVPGGFTPDDNSLNEIFRPVSGYIFGDVRNPALRYEFRILNRWGQQVFYTNSPAMGWDGTMGGNPCMSGLYIYEVKAVGFDGIPHRKQGTVYLMR